MLEAEKSPAELKEKAFQSYNWDADRNWKSFYETLIPKPGDRKLDRMKRRWYKIHYDISFDTNYKQQPVKQPPPPSMVP